MSFTVSPGERIRLKGDSIAIGYGFGNYRAPSPLRSIHGMSRILMRDNMVSSPEFDALPGIWLGQIDGIPIRVDSMPEEIRIYHADGRLVPGDWLLFEEAGEVDRTVHP